MNTFEQKETALTLVAFASLKHWGEETTSENIQCEKYRFERVIEEHYLNKDKEYNTFVLEFLQKNAYDMVYTNKFLGDIVLTDKSNPEAVHYVEHRLILN